MGQPLGDFKCHCGAPATRGVRDVQEIQPTLDPNEPGMYLERWEPRGEPRVGCDEHPPDQPMRYYRDGRVLPSSKVPG